MSGRAELIAALARKDPELTAAMASMLGFEIDPAAPHESTSPSASGHSSSATSGEREDVEYHPADVPFWRLDAYEAVTSEAGPSKPPTRTAADPVWRDRPETAPGFTPLLPKRMVLTRLRQTPATHRITNEIDDEAVVERVSRGDLLHDMPHRQRRAWGSMVHIVEDRARRLTPYWLDQEYVTHILQQMYPPGGVAVSRSEDDAYEPVMQWPRERYGQPVAPAPGEMVLVLGDLGVLAQNGEPVQRFWLRWGRWLRTHGVSAVALVPLASRDVPRAFAQVWTVVSWNAGGPTGSGIPSRSTAAVQSLLTLLSPVVRLEPGLLRAVRQVLPEGRGDAGLEARVWQNEAIASGHSVAATWAQGPRQANLARFAQEPFQARRLVLQLIQQWRADLHEAVWFEEVDGLDTQSRTLVARDAEDANAFWAACAEAFSDAGAPSSENAAWILRMAERLPLQAWRRNPSIQRLFELVKPRDADAPVPAGYDPARSSSTDQAPRQLALWQAAGRLHLQPAAAPAPHRASPLGALQTANGEVALATGVADDFWLTGQPPTWAHRWGRDRFGPWVTFRVDGVEQRLRWMPPGRFVMGSPEDEDGRYDDESPQHEVQLSRGFWLFDTPCTQGLWQAVMGENPSEFEGANRPVEQVSWEDCQRFVEALNAKLPGLALQLPTEAEWEYACRAGTTEARYHEDLDAIAWFGDNSDQQTHDVAQKLPNDWGLYDMLGNVYEWCRDGWSSDYTGAAAVDPVGSAEADADRVVRGGCWFGPARGARAAFRFAYLPGVRYGYLGFRCSSSNLSEPRRARVTGREPELAERAEATTRRPAARLLHVREDTELATALPDDGGFRLNTDRDRLMFQRITRPPWAAEIGRDAHGLWAFLEVDDVRQRLRWMPPGRFWMGSPDTDGEAFDFEKPQHEVLLSRGYWLFDTPCTQALWQAVMGSNPSEFKGENRPVERVNWKDCQGFIERMNARFKGLELGLPTEAEWEYACRAGTQTPRYDEDLDRIAWYDGSISDGTRDVREKAPNYWGLYDMLGNVYEWCHDGLRQYTGESAVNPVGSAAVGANRVIRGGGWVNPAQFARAAYRSAGVPGSRYGYLGFRCSSSQGRWMTPF